jgi:competence protein ComEC
VKLGYTILVLAAITIWAAVALLPDGKLRVVFCDVGQGDAILISQGTSQLLIDGGPNDNVIKCLSDHMPFFDRRIEAVILTHNDSDHSRGLSYVRERYSVLYYEPKLVKGDIVRIRDFRFIVEWPRKDVLGDMNIGEDNTQAIAGKLQFGNFDVLLTSDTPTKFYLPESGVEVVKVPHHGSKVEFDPGWWAKEKPELAIISVGKNSYGHPTQEVIRTLKDLGIEILRTDEEGDIEIVSNGILWQVKK